ERAGGGRRARERDQPVIMELSGRAFVDAATVDDGERVIHFAGGGIVVSGGAGGLVLRAEPRLAVVGPEDVVQDDVMGALTLAAGDRLGIDERRHDPGFVTEGDRRRRQAEAA